MWAVEEIPNNDSLFYRIHQQYIRYSELKPKVFQEFGDGEDKGLSTDWEEYSNPEDTRNRARKPEQNGVASMIAGFLRGLKLTVEHAPIENHPDFEDNRAHTNVTGIDKTDGHPDEEIRLKLLEHIKWEIDPPVEINKSGCRV